MVNLDFMAAESSSKLIERVDKDLDKLIREGTKISKDKEFQKLSASLRKGLGVLLENGVYAFFVYLLASNADYSKTIAEEMFLALKGLQGCCNNENLSQKPDTEKKAGAAPKKLAADAILQWIQKEIVSELPSLLLAREYLQQVLVYARYSADAKKLEAEIRKQTANAGGGGEKT